MKKDICTCSIRQATDRGFLDFAKGVKYDLDSMTFHADPKANKATVDSLRTKHFKNEPIEINKTSGGKKK